MATVIGNAIYAIPDMATDFAALFSTTATYAVGDYCIYQNVLYKCHTAVATAGAWTGTTNWTQTSVDNELDNKVDKVAGKGLSKNDFTDALKTKLGAIEEEAEKNVQSDWNQTDNTKDDFIKNKPTVDTALSGTSTNAVQNKAIKAAIDLKLDKEDYYMYDIDANKTYLVTRSFVNGFLVEHFEEVTA